VSYNESEFLFALFRVDTARMSCIEGLISRMIKLVYEVARNTAL
jgi:hypothetical protein